MGIDPPPSLPPSPPSCLSLPPYLESQRLPSRGVLCVLRDGSLQVVPGQGEGGEEEGGGGRVGGRGEEGEGEGDSVADLVVFVLGEEGREEGKEEGREGGRRGRCRMETVKESHKRESKKGGREGGSVGGREGGRGAYLQGALEKDADGGT